LAAASAYAFAASFGSGTLRPMHPEVETRKTIESGKTRRTAGGIFIGSL
jgi:hypothetical protein